MRPYILPRVVILREGDTWASCSIKEFGHVGKLRHIVRKGGLTTACGASASHPDVWRQDSRKPRCRDCVKAYLP